ncbi:hypothetical protein QA600_16895 [Natronococcus sp. A-GB1]|uniref:hypothetical protein n=1 Tax=Natronococcus sp. A-GB1 TaxID=3037648 RepID=UPI00241D8E94|nr:hypothetical protein [Natronococcus sp. A-GB1]MDG5761012.1 hypothetical protein [Natronococcus sp. A-GB1]
MFPQCRRVREYLSARAEPVELPEGGDLVRLERSVGNAVRLEDGFEFLEAAIDIDPDPSTWASGDSLGSVSKCAVNSSPSGW